MDLRFHCGFCILLVSNVLERASAQSIYTDSHHYQLITDLFAQDTRGFIPATLPVRNSSEALTVYMGVTLAQLVDLNEQSQVSDTGATGRPQRAVSGE